jgi:hypothetical protein
MRLFYYDSNLDKQYLSKDGQSTIGLVNYTTGSIELNNLNIVGLEGQIFELVIKPESNDVISIRNQVLTIPDDKIIVNVIIDKIASGDSAGNANYVFTTSRS